MKTLIKKILRTLAPRRFDAMMMARENRHGQRFMESQGVPAVAAAVVARCGSKVQAGPFAGMEYITQAAGSSYVPKLIGSYEAELHETLDRIFATRYESVVDVGSAEGFYAVGVAMRLSDAPQVCAFDINPDAQKLCRELAQKNGVGDRVVVAGFCDTTVLREKLVGRSLVICDCEGYEAELLQPEKVSGLASADVLVELHDFLRPGLTPMLVERFAPTHRVTLIDSRDRDPADYPSIGFLTPDQQRVAVSEYRNGPQQWAFMTPKSSA